MKNSLVLIYFLLLFSISAHSKKFKNDEKPDWAKKDIRDFSDADMERLLDQWEVIANLLFLNVFNTNWFFRRMKIL